MPRSFHWPASSLRRPALTLPLLTGVAIYLLPACRVGTNDDDPFGRGIDQETTPHLVETKYIDTDQNGVDEGDVLLLRWNRPVRLTGTTPEAIASLDPSESLGDDARLSQCLPGDVWTEVRLGRLPDLRPGAPGSIDGTAFNVSAVGAGIAQVVGLDGARAGPAAVAPRLIDVTGVLARLDVARYVDADNSGSVNEGDLLLAFFDKPLQAGGSTVADNFALPVAGDSFGATPSLASASADPENRGLTITLGPGARLRAGGAFDPSALAAGAPSGLSITAAPTLTDTLATTPQLIAPSRSVDLGVQASSSLSDGQDAVVLVGRNDPTQAPVSTRSLDAPSGVDVWRGPVDIDGAPTMVDLAFLADRDNDRVLIFSGDIASSSAAASFVLGQAGLNSIDGVDSDDSRLESPTDVAFDGTRNRLYVADTGHHRVLVFDGLLEIDEETSLPRVRNGRAASRVIGQPSFTAVQANVGQPSPFATSLSSPSGVEVSPNRLFIADTGNHRVLTYETGDAGPAALPNAVLGQANFTSGDANRGSAADGSTLSSPTDVAVSDTVVLNGSTGAVFVADSGNHRVLQFTSPRPSTGDAAVVALGQVDLMTTMAGVSATALDTPTDVHLAAATGELWIADSGNHRIVYQMPTVGVFATGQPGTAIGQATADAGDPNRGAAPAANSLFRPLRLASAGMDLFIADRDNQRVLVRDTLPTADGAADRVIGQADFNSSNANAGPLNDATAALLVGGRLVVSDTGGHRVLIWDTPPSSGETPADVVLGQFDLSGSAANRGLAAPTATTLNAPTALATDGNSLVVADTGNHRVLIWDVLPTASGTAADAVLGQADDISAAANRGGLPSAASLSRPTGVALADGRLAVADTDNHRVLIWDDFAMLATGTSADAVLGQGVFNSGLANRGGRPGANTLSSPADVLLSSDSIWIADTDNDRVLVFPADVLPTGSAAIGLFGQGSFDRVDRSFASPRTLSRPSGLALDRTGSRLFVADAGYHRVVSFDARAGSPEEGRPFAGSVLGQADLASRSANRGRGSPDSDTLSQPSGLFFNGWELLVADRGNGRILRYR